MVKRFEFFEFPCIPLFALPFSEIFCNALPEEEVDLAQVLHELSKVGFEDLPPGGLVTK